MRSPFSKQEIEQVILSRAQRVVMTRLPGRPQHNPLGDRFAGWKMKTASGQPMRCRMAGCQRRLRKNQEAIVCSPACHAELLRYCGELLAILRGDGRAKDLPMYYRPSRNRRKKPRAQL
jgi:hypothetical protein